MIIQVRVDDRLVHGQIVIVQAKELNIPLLVIANDGAAKNEVMQMTLKIAVPNDIRLPICSVDDAIDVFNDPRSKDRRIFVIVNSVTGAIKIAKNMTSIEGVNVINAGRSDRSGPATKTMVFPSAQLNPEELEIAKELISLIHMESYNQVLPTNSGLSLKQAAN